MKRLALLLPLLALAAAPARAEDPATNAAADSLIREIALRESSKNVKLHEHILDCFKAGTNALAKGFDGIALAKFEEMERVASLVNGLPAVENLADIREQARKLAKEIRQTADPRHRLSGTVSKIVPNASNDDFAASSATVSDWTLTVLNGNTGEPPSLRLVRGGEPVDWRPPERLAAWVAGTHGKFVVSPFRGILGFDGFRVDALSGTTGSRLTCYLAVIGDDLVPVADSFGDPGDEDHAVDLDGDGLDELVCDVTWEMGGHPRVHVFRRMDDVSMLCDDPTPLLPEPASSLAWAGHLRERYDPKTKTIRIRYLPERRVQESHGSIGEEMYEEVACPILLERLSWHPATNAPATHAESGEGAKDPAP